MIMGYPKLASMPSAHESKAHDLSILKWLAVRTLAARTIVFAAILFIPSAEARTPLPV